MTEAVPAGPIFALACQGQTPDLAHDALGESAAPGAETMLPAIGTTACIYTVH